MRDDPGHVPGQPDLYLAEGELSDFVGWLDSTLGVLRDSALDPAQVGRLGAASAHFGASSAASEIFTRYETVRARLVELVRAQQEAIELLGLTTTLMENDYQATEAGQVDRLRRITANFEALYAVDTDPAMPRTGGGGRDAMQ
jgi:hypothetical protein